MNIFILDKCPVKSAQMQCDKHIVKMPLESAQMLSTAHRVLDGDMYYDVSNKGNKVRRYALAESNDVFYKAVHQGHPCVIWTMESKANYDWHYRHFVALCDEYTHRYGRMHLSEEKLKVLLRTPPKNTPDIGPTDFRLAMSLFPECIVKGNPVESYKNYYLSKLSYVKMVWTKRDMPQWFKNKVFETY